ncbi:MAG: response regulator [Actinomycetia bacterium]|nr:response regulator [Actinomycetes bacterium]
MTRPTVLLVEDNPVNLELAKDVLENYGFEVLSATNGLEALEVVEKAPPRLILMDLQLPGMSGIAVIECLKANELTAHIPIVAVTAFAMSADETRARAAGCVGFITKPINTREFPQQVNEFLDMEVQKTT